MDEMEFDRTRKAIGADNLDQQSRRDMMNRLRDAGGEVKTERSLREGPGGAGGGGGRAAGGSGGGSDRKMPSDLARERLRMESEARASARRALMDAEKEATSFMARLSIKFRCRMSGLTPFGRSTVYPRFMSQLNLDAKRAVMECNILAKDLFSANPQIGRSIIKELDKRQPLYVELIERAAELYNPAELSDLTSPYNASPTSPVPLDAIRAPLFSLLRKLYYLKSFQETYLTAVETAIGLQQQLEKKQAGLYASKRKKIASDWKALMNEIYPSLVLLAQRAEMKQAESGSRLFEDMLGISDDKRLGRRQAGSPVGKAAEPAKPEEAPEKAEESDEADAEPEAVEVNEDLELGMRLMKSLVLADLRKKHDAHGELAGVADNDKVLLSHLFLREFESEYSFILTTQKIQLNPAYQQGKKVDYHQRLADIFEQIRPAVDSFKQYAHQTQEYNRTLADGHAQGTNYVEYAKRIQLMETRRGASGRETRIAVKNFMEKVHQTLSALLEDIRTKTGKIVLNPTEALKFDVQIEGRRKMQGRTVEDALRECYAFALALATRIDSGDLFGGVIELSDEDFKKAFGLDSPPADVPDAVG